MSKIKVLDCTLRDGGYVNNWMFGEKNIQHIIDGLINANVDIIECGYLNNTKTYPIGSSTFSSLTDISQYISVNKSDCEFVCMINYGDFNINDLPICDNSSVTGIRVAFHKKDIDGALEFCAKVKELGYKLYVQPMVSLSYSDIEYINLIQRVNSINPYAFYIVDSFGVMRNKDLMRLFYLVEQNLDEHICIGYHSHNNLQLAFSNAQSMVTLNTPRSIIIDSSVFGMGRGAGNLNTELFVEYLNNFVDRKYEIKPLLRIMDEVLSNIYFSNYWGYSLPHYLSAVHNCHPNYASYLDSKKTLTVEDIDIILNTIPIDSRSNFNKNTIETLYLEFMSKVTQNPKTDIVMSIFKNKRILVICPGQSCEVEKDMIKEFAKNDDIITISVNFDYQHIDTNYIFLSNLRRLQNISKSVYNKTIITSNINDNSFPYIVEYESLLNNKPHVSDNAALMLVKLLIECGAKELFFAGLDGYSYDTAQNYANKELALTTPNIILRAMNEEMSSVLSQYKNEIDIHFLTTSKFITIKD